MTTPINLPARITQRANGLFDVTARISGENVDLGVEIHDFDDASTIARDFNRHAIPGQQFGIAAQDNTSAVVTFGGVPVAILTLNDMNSFRNGEPQAEFTVRGIEAKDGLLSDSLTSSRVGASSALRVATDTTVDDLLNGRQA
jgi:hypothetical protein